VQDLSIKDRFMHAGEFKAGQGKGRQQQFSAPVPFTVVMEILLPAMPGLG
jgi:hypothetical protein